MQEDRAIEAPMTGLRGLEQPGHRNNWIRGFRFDADALRNEDARRVGLRLCDAMVRWNDGQGPSPNLDLVRHALRCRSKPLAMITAAAVSAMLSHEDDPAPVLRDLFESATAAGRAMLVGEMPWPDTLHRQDMCGFIGKALDDRSIEVRVRAVFAANKHGLRELVPQMLAMVEGEKSKRLKEAILHYAPLLRDGYLIEEANDEWTRIWIRLDHGRQCLSVPTPVIEEWGAGRIAAHIRDCEAEFPPRAYAWDEEGADMPE